MARLIGKRCVVTGAARGVGAAIACAFAAEGAAVVATDIDSPRVAALAAEIDGAAEADWARLAERWPEIDVLVNNAGVTGLEGAGGPHNPEHARLAEWRRVHAVNLDGVFLGRRSAIRAMRGAGRGSIINISSRSGMVGAPAAAVYAASKAAVRNRTKSVALYCAEQGLEIRCDSIHPGAILTPMWEPMLGDGPDRAAHMAAAVADTPQRRFGAPEEVAAIAVLLASDEARYMTGAALTIDGGLCAGSAAVERS